MISRLWRLTRVLAMLGGAALALTIAAVVWQSGRMWDRHGAARSLDMPVDAIIVLASGVDPDRVLSYSPRRRVKAGVAAWQAGKTSTLIMSGGTVTGTDLTGAAMMRDYAVDLGMPAGSILLEDRSRTTFENLRFSFAIAAEAGHARLAVLTDQHHLTRAALLAWYFGQPDIALVAARGLQYRPLSIRAAATGREACAWWFNALKIAGWELLGMAGVSPGDRRELIY